MGFRIVETQKYLDSELNDLEFVFKLTGIFIDNENNSITFNYKRIEYKNTGEINKVIPMSYRYTTDEEIDNWDLALENLFNNEVIPQMKIRNGIV